MRAGWRLRLARWIAGERAEALGAVSSTVDDSPGWGQLTLRPHDYDPARVQEIYTDALTAWRKNPLAWRIVAITTDFVVGDAIRVSSPRRELNRFIEAFWNHPKNRMSLRLEAMCDELSRAGDLFVLLFRNPEDGMSYIRFVTKDRIHKITSAENDWENELSYEEPGMNGEADRVWLSPHHPESSASPAVMLHYAVNRPAGALLGESDLTTLLPWLQRYSRMLEDRVRLNWAIRSFLWIVTVPANLVRQKMEQYRTPPESGSIIVKDESERWEPVAPMLHGHDAEADLKAVRQMVDAGSGYPPHWRGEAADANLATATAMQAPTEKHLARRQLYFAYMLQDILYHAYQRAAQIGKARRLPGSDYAQYFTVSMAEVTQTDNQRLGAAAQAVAQAMESLHAAALQARAPSLVEAMLRLVFKFAGEALPEGQVGRIMAEIRGLADFNDGGGGEKEA